MRVFLIGAAGKQKPRLEVLLGNQIEVVALPQEAMTEPIFDAGIAEGDVLVSLRLRRPASALPRIGLLHLPGAGLDGIDMAALHPSTKVCNVFEHEDPIAEYVMWAMLDWTLRPALMKISTQGWSDTYRSRRTHAELLDRTVGIFGFGRIGQAVARRARAFGMKVATLERENGADYTLADIRITGNDLPKLLGLSDFVVLAAPLNEKTRGQFGLKQFEAMKRDAVLINVSRAELAVEDELYMALKDETIGGAYLDVWYRYPIGGDDQVPPSRHPLVELPNVTGTAHASAWTDALAERRYARIADNILRYRSGLNLLNQVAGPC